MYITKYPKREPGGPEPVSITVNPFRRKLHIYSAYKIGRPGVESMAVDCDIIQIDLYEEPLLPELHQDKIDQIYADIRKEYGEGVVIMRTGSTVRQVVHYKSVNAGLMYIAINSQQDEMAMACMNVAITRDKKDKEAFYSNDESE